MWKHYRERIMGKFNETLCSRLPSNCMQRKSNVTVYNTYIISLAYKIIFLVYFHLLNLKIKLFFKLFFFSVFFFSLQSLYLELEMYDLDVLDTESYWEGEKTHIIFTFVWFSISKDIDKNIAGFTINPILRLNQRSPKTRNQF